MAQGAHHPQNIGDQRLGQPPPLVLPADGHPVQPAAAGAVPPGDVLVGGGGCHLLPGGVLHKDHPAAQGVLPAAVVPLPDLRPLGIAGQFPGGALDADPGVPVPGAEKDEPEALGEGIPGNTVQIALQKKLVIPDTGVVIVKTHCGLL